MSDSQRSMVLIIGTKPIETLEFFRRRLTPKVVELEDLNEELLNQSCGVVLSEFPGKYRVTQEYFLNHFLSVCELGLITSVLSSEQRDTDYIIKFRDAALGSNRNDSASKFEWAVCDRIEAVHEVAEKLARHEPGPTLGNVAIRTLDTKLRLEAGTEALLKRAFWDCDTIVVEQLQGGKTAKETFRVFASIKGPLHGPQPLPFFVKIGTPLSIEEEKENYKERAEPFIPFHLRPTLNTSRCVSTATSAALVCDFVGNAVPIRTAWLNSQGDGTVFSLFEVTLRGLRGHTARAPKEPGNVTAFLKERVRAGKIASEAHGPARIARAKELGLSRDPEQIEAALLALSVDIKSRRGTYHGDLHCGNVMVRNHDAIVIDFGSMRDFGPITADPSILEVSLLFGTDASDDPAEFEEWKSLVDDLTADPLRPPVHDIKHFRLAWLRKAVRELRHIGSCCEIEPNEGLIVFAGCLLRFGRLSIMEFPDPARVELSEARRAYALVIADRICSKIKHADPTS